LLHYSVEFDCYKPKLQKVTSRRDTALTSLFQG
jgi:hypothetical protein